MEINIFGREVLFCFKTSFYRFYDYYHEYAVENYFENPVGKTQN